MLELKNIVFEVPVEEGSSKTKRIIDDISLTVEENRFVVVTGPNGGGKSTLAKLWESKLQQVDRFFSMDKILLMPPLPTAQTLELDTVFSNLHASKA